MTPKEKASELLDKFDIGEQIPYHSINHALLAVDELINETLELDRLKYWNEVKNEIKKTN